MFYICNIVASICLIKGICSRTIAIYLGLLHHGFFSEYIVCSLLRHSIFLSSSKDESLLSFIHNSFSSNKWERPSKSDISFVETSSILSLC